MQELEKYDESIECFDKAISLNPNCIDAIINMGISYFKKGLFSEAVVCYDKALRLNPDDFVLNYNKIQALSMMNMVNSALEICDKLENKLIPEHLYFLFLEEAKLYEKSNQPLKALECFDKAISLNPNLIYAWQNKAIFLYGYNKHKALECYDKIIQLDPRNIDIHETRVKILMELGDIQGILNSLTNLINLCKNNPLYWYERAMIYIQIKKIPETIADLKITFQLDGNYRTKALENDLFKEIFHLIKDL